MNERPICPLRTWLLLAANIALFLFSTPAIAAEFTGQVVRESDGVPIAGARVTLDATPGGEVDFETFSTAFGIFLFDDAPAGNYDFKVTRGGYADSTGTVTLGANLTTAEVELVANGPESHDIYTSVHGVMTGVSLPDSTIVATRFPTAVGGAGTPAGTMMAGASGEATFHSMSPGFYEFQVTPPDGGWEQYDSPRVELTKTHHASFNLNPVKFDLEVMVDGFDPGTEANGPLEGVFVVVTGEDDEGSISPTVAPRTGVTDENGRILFKGLPSGVPYFVATKHLGYAPDGDGLPAPRSSDQKSMSFSLEIDDRSLEVELTNEFYEKAEVFTGLKVELFGLKGTNTEDITREMTTGTPANMRLFENLLPGRYEVRVEGKGNAAGLEIHPEFDGVEAVEIFEEDAPPLDRESKTELEMELDVRQVQIIGQLFCAESKAISNQSGKLTEFDALLGAAPSYTPMSGEQIVFMEAEANPCLKSDKRSFPTTTDDEGRFSISLPPALYGMKMTQLTEHWGSHVLLKEVGEAPEPLPLIPPINFFNQSPPVAGQGWPFAETWNFPGQPPSNGSPKAGLPLKLDGTSYELDAYIRAQVISVSGDIAPETAPTNLHLIGFERRPNDAGFGPIKVTDYRDFDIDGTATLTSSSGESYESPIYRSFKPRRLDGGSQIDSHYHFGKIPPGTYTLSFSHPRYTIKKSNLAGESITPPTTTWTIKPWSAPGVLPTTDPSAIDAPAPMTTIPPGGFDFANFSFFQATYDEGGPITIRRWDWIEQVLPEDPPAHYELAETDVHSAGDSKSFSYLQASYAGARVFSSAGKIPKSPFTFWDGLKANASGGAQAFDHYRGGPMENSYETEELGAPTEFNSLPKVDTPGGGNTFPLRVEAINAAEPDGEPIDDLTIVLNGDVTVTSGQVNQLTTEFLSSFNQPINIAGGDWEGDTDGDQIQQFDGDGNIIGLVEEIGHEFVNIDLEDGIDLIPTLTVRVRRPWNLGGTVLSNDTGEPIEGATILVCDRFGSPLAQAITDALGKWGLPPNVPALKDNSPPVFVDVKAPGCIPNRKRVTSTEQPPGMVTPLEITSNMVPMPPPTIETPTWDREGTFITNFSFSSKGNLVPDALYLTWTAEIIAAPHSFMQKPFDDPGNGAEQKEEMVTRKRKPVNVYLVNPRGSPQNAYRSTPEVNFIYKPGTDSDLAKIHEWFNAILKRQPIARNVFVTRRAAVPTEGDSEGHFDSMGRVRIWKLAPWEFRPIVVVEMDDGGLSIRSDFADPTTDQSDPDIEPLMEGTRLPTWLGNAANMMGVVDALTGGGSLTPEARAKVAQALDGVFPKGKFSGLPGVRGEITTVGEGERKGLKYDYRAQLSWLEGMSSPATKWLRFMPDPAGTELTFEVGMGLDNSREDTPFFIEGSLTDAPPPSELVPTSLEPLQTPGKAPKRSLSVTSSLKASISVFGSEIDDEGFFELEVKTKVLADFLTELEINLKPILSKIPPPTGPILQGLDAKKVLQLFMTLDTGLGAELEQTWKTKPPKSPPVGDHVPLVGFPFGAHNRDSTVAKLGLHLQGGIKAKMFSERVTAAVAVGTIDGGDFSFPTTTVTFDDTTGWPSLKKIKGTLGMMVSGEVKTWIVNWKKSWNIPIIEIDQSFTTEAFFSWEPVEIAFTVQSPGDSPPPTLNPNGSTLIDDLYLNSTIAAAQGALGGDELLVFSGINPANGRMTVEAGLRSIDGDFGTAKVIAEAAGIIDVAATRLDNGTWLTVWSEIAGADIAKMFPTSSVRYSISTNGVTWSAPTTIGPVFPDVAAQLRLASLGNLAVLGIASTPGGPTSDIFNLHLASFANGTWSDPTRQLEERTLVDFDIAAFGSTAAPRIIVATTDGTAATESFIWNTTNGQITNLPSINEAASRVSLSGGQQQRVALARSIDGGDTRVLLLDEPSGNWEPDVVSLPGQNATKVKITALGAGAAHAYLVSWVNGGGVSALNFAYLNADASLATFPVIAEGSIDGEFSDIFVLNRGAEDVIIGADPGGGNVRQAIVSRSVETVSVSILNPAYSKFFGFSADVIGVPGRRYRIMRSSDLVNWIEIDNVQSGQGFLDADAIDGNQFFYRSEEE